MYCPCVFMFNTLRPRQNGRHFADDIFKRILFNENVWILIKISLKFVPKGPINKIPALFQIMAWRRPGDKPLSEAMLVSLLTHKCVTRPQWVKSLWSSEDAWRHRRSWSSKVPVLAYWCPCGISSSSEDVLETQFLRKMIFKEIIFEIKFFHCLKCSVVLL